MEKVLTKEIPAKQKFISAGTKGGKG